MINYIIDNSNMTGIIYSIYDNSNQNITINNTILTSNDTRLYLYSTSEYIIIDQILKEKKC